MLSPADCQIMWISIFLKYSFGTIKYRIVLSHIYTYIKWFSIAGHRITNSVARSNLRVRTLRGSPTAWLSNHSLARLLRRLLSNWASSPAPNHLFPFAPVENDAQNPVAAAAAAADDSMQDADPAPRRCSPRIVNQKHLGFIVPPLGQQRYPPMVGTDIAASRTHGGRRSWCTGGP